ncbi:MAG TPA: Na(+)-translocating NADH-quinone reductase subunit C [Woeseiaceae bacterium]
MPDPATGRDSLRNMLTVAISLSLACSLLVASTAVLLKPRQEQNRERYRQTIILDVAGLYHPGDDVEAAFAQIDTQIVDLESGQYVQSVDASAFDPLSRDPAQSVSILPEHDQANLKRRSRYAAVYLVSENDELQQIILPVYGSGLWSTMYGYLALEGDAKTIAGLRFYEHAETPGLGDQVDSPRWLAQWRGKKAFGPDGQPRIEVIRGTVSDQDGGSAEFQVDGLSGATLTSRAVTNLLHYWLGSDGFGPYLERLQQEASQ